MTADQKGKINFETELRGFVIIRIQLATDYFRMVEENGELI
jgi:hypothetical protein